MKPPDMTRDFLTIERYLQDAFHARTLQVAFDMGVIDQLAEYGPSTPQQLFHNRSCDAAGADFLTKVLTAAGVLQIDHSLIDLTTEFRTAFKYRDLLLTKLQFSDLVAADFFNRLPQLLSSSEEFMGTSRLFELFDYSRCQDVTPQNCLHASRWMKLTTILTRYEAPVCCEHFAFAEHQQMLDLGGNSGEFALQICQRNPALQVTVADLPVVCHVGVRHVAQFPEAHRIHFHPLNFINDPLPAGHDLITCKSVLHDWPDDITEVIIRKCFHALPENGRLLILERRLWDAEKSAIAYGSLPVLLFFRSYRSPDFYTTLLNAVGFSELNVQIIPMEVPFMLITAVASKSIKSPSGR